MVCSYCGRHFYGTYWHKVEHGVYGDYSSDNRVFCCEGHYDAFYREEEPPEVVVCAYCGAKLIKDKCDDIATADGYFCDTDCKKAFYDEKERREHKAKLEKFIYIDGAYYSVDKSTLVEVDKTVRVLAVREGTLFIAKRACFLREQLKRVTFPKSLEEIGEEAFAYCSALTSVTFAKSGKLKKIGTDSFSPSGLTEIDIPEGVEEIGHRAFSNCPALSSVTIPASVKKIGEHAFDCRALTSKNFNGTAEQWEAVKNGIKWAAAEKGKNGNENISAIAAKCSDGAGEAKTKRELVARMIRVIKEMPHPFLNEDSSTEEEVREKETQPAAGHNLRQKEFTMKCTNCGADLADSAKFCPECGTKVVREVFCAQCGTKLSAGAKFCPECGTKVGAAATPEPKAESAPKAEAAAESAPKAEAAAESAPKAEAVAESAPKAEAQKESSPKDNGSSKWLTINGGVLTDCDRKAEGEVIIPEEVTRIGKEAFKGCESLTSVVIPESVTEIGEEAFRGCDSLASVVIPESVTEIGEEAFRGCDSLTSVVIPKSVTEIGKEAFYGCESLASVVIPKSVTKIGYEAFKGCDSLTSVVIPESVTKIGYEAFRGCDSLASVVIPESVTEIGYEAFCGCDSLTSVVIPESVTEIGKEAFYGCDSLASVVIPESVTEIGRSAFSRCESLSSIKFGGTKKEWKAVEKGENWHEGVPAKGVECSDGLVKFGLFGLI